MNKILSFLGLSKEAESSLSEDQRNTLESAEQKLNELESGHQAALAEKEGKIASLEAAQKAAEDELNTVKESNTSLSAEKSTLEAQLKESQDKIAVLEKQPDVKGAAAGKSGDENGGEGGNPRPKYSWEEKAEKKSKTFKTNE